MLTSQIPFDWYSSPRYFIMYWGEIFFGTVFELPDYQQGFFIIQPDKVLDAVKPENRTVEKYRQLGREINDINAIKGIQNEIGHEGQFANLRHSGSFKRMFVFGAAASAYCVFGNTATNFRDSDLNPPTGYEIFSSKYEDIINRFPGARLSIPLFESKGNDIEECLESEWLSYKGFYSPQMVIRHVNIQFYLQSLFQDISKNVVDNYYRCNLYSLFANKLQNHLIKSGEKVSVVSFNYDTILEDFIAQFFQREFNTMEDYVNLSSSNLLLFKPHGSCNWGWKFDAKAISDVTNENIADHLYTHKIEPWEIYFKLLGNLLDVAKNSWGMEHSEDKYSRGRFTINKNLIQVINKKARTAYFPALLLPYRDKDEMVMPYSHWEALKAIAVPDIEELYLIGWKGNEDLFNKKLQQAHKLKKIIIVNPDSETVKSNLSMYIDLSKFNIETVTTIEEFVLNHLDNYLAKN